jgi:hypothetical protein
MRAAQRDGRPGYEAWLLKFLRPRLIRLICIRTPDVLDVDRDPDSADLDVLRAPRLENRLPSVWLVQAGRRATLRRLPLACSRNPLARPRGRVKLNPASALD